MLAAMRPSILCAFMASTTLLWACGARSLLGMPDAAGTNSGGSGGTGTTVPPGDTGGGGATTSSSSSTSTTSSTSSSSSTSGAGGGPTTMCGDLTVVWSVPLAEHDEPILRVMDVDPQGTVFVMSGDGFLDRIGSDGVLQQHTSIGLAS